MSHSLLKFAALSTTIVFAFAWTLHAQTGQPGTAGTTGAAGAAGTAGTAGVAGATGAAGTAGTASQAGNPGQPVPGGQSAASQTGIPGQSGTSSNFQPTGQLQGQVPPVAQPNAVAPGVGRTPNNVGVNTGAGFPVWNNALNGVAPTPWFNDLGARQQLQLNQLQFNQLGRAYNDAWVRYNQGLTNLDANLSAQERAVRMRALQDAFNRDFGRTLDTTITDPRVRQRYNQLNWQFQGFGALNDPQFTQQLNLTPEQHQRLRLMSNQWNQQLRLLQQQAANNPALFDERFNELRRQARDQMSIVLTPTQQEVWPQLMGQYYDFPPNMLFPQSQTAAPANANAVRTGIPPQRNPQLGIPQQRNPQLGIPQQGGALNVPQQSPAPAPQGAIAPQNAAQPNQPTTPGSTQ